MRKSLLLISTILVASIVSSSSIFSTLDQVHAQELVDFTVKDVYWSEIMGQWSIIVDYHIEKPPEPAQGSCKIAIVVDIEADPSWKEANKDNKNAVSHGECRSDLKAIEGKHCDNGWISFVWPDDFPHWAGKLLPTVGDLKKFTVRVSRYGQNGGYMDTKTHTLPNERKPEGWDLKSPFVNVDMAVPGQTQSYVFDVWNPYPVNYTDVRLDINTTALPYDWNWTMDPPPGQVFTLSPNETREASLSITPPMTLVEGTVAQVEVKEIVNATGEEYMFTAYEEAYDNVPPIITIISATPQIVCSNGYANFIVNASDSGAGIHNVTLHYQIQGNWNTEPMEWKGGDYFGQTQFNVTVGPFSYPNILYYFFSVSDEVGNIAESSTYRMIIAAPSVGGYSILIGKPNSDLSAPNIGLPSTIIIAIVATAIYVKRAKRGKEK